MSSFYQAIRPLLSVNKILGICSFKFDKTGYKVSKINIYINIITCVLYLALSCCAIYKREVQNFTLIAKTTDRMQLSVTTVFVITTWLFSACQQKIGISILIKMVTYDKEMRKLGVWSTYKKLNQLIYKHIGIRFVLCIISIGIQELSSVLTEYGSVINEIIFEVLFQFPIIINTLVCQEMSVYLYFLKERFQILNKHLSALQTTKNHFLTDNIKIIKLQTFLGTKLKILRLICPLHHELCKLSEIINKRFGIILLTTFLNTFISSVVNLYFFSIYWNKPNEPNRGIVLITGIFNCTTYIIETVYICYKCNSVVEEANKSGTLIHTIETDDNNVQDQIEMFSLQIAHKRVEFSAAGLFPINYSLIFSIIGGVATNLVILIQFSAT